MLYLFKAASDSESSFRV